MNLCQAAKAVELLDLFVEFWQEAAIFTASTPTAVSWQGIQVPHSWHPLALSQLLQSQAVCRQWLICWCLADICFVQLDFWSWSFSLRKKQHQKVVIQYNCSIAISLQSRWEHASFPKPPKPVSAGQGQLYKSDCRQRLFGYLGFLTWWYLYLMPVNPSIVECKWSTYYIILCGLELGPWELSHLQDLGS